MTIESFRSLYVLDVTGQLYEKMIRTRLREVFEHAGSFDENQHDFREARSTVGEISTLWQEVERACSGNHMSRKVAVLITFDVKNTFNTQLQ